jgi:hypothetical protein
VTDSADRAASQGRGYAYGGPAFVGGIFVGIGLRGWFHPDGVHRRAREVVAEEPDPRKGRSVSPPAQSDGRSRCSRSRPDHAPRVEV